MFMGSRNWFQGMNSASLCSLAGRYENPNPPRCLAPIDFLKIPAQFCRFLMEWKPISYECRWSSKLHYMQSEGSAKPPNIVTKSWKKLLYFIFFSAMLDYPSKYDAMLGGGGGGFHCIYSWECFSTYEGIKMRPCPLIYTKLAYTKLHIHD